MNRIFDRVNILGASPEAFDQTRPAGATSILDGPRSHEREQVVLLPLAHARGYSDQGEASFAVSHPNRMNKTD